MTKLPAWIGLAGCVLLAAWLAWSPPRGAPPDPAGTPARDPAHAGPSLEEMPLDAVAEGRSARREEGDPDPAPVTSLHVPDYGPDLARPAARAEFDLRDARGAPLEGAVVVGASLRRVVGEERIDHPVALRRDLSSAVGAGLPPGDYELEVLGGPYGTHVERFALARGGFVRGTIALPRWRRILKLAIQDNLGRPLGRITQAPEYTYEAEPEAPAAFRLFSRSRRGWEAFYETDGGAYYLRVFAGLAARVKIDIEKQRYGRDAIVLESDFTGAEWADYPIVLEPVPGLGELMDGGWVDVNPDDPGSRSLLSAPINPPPPENDPRELGDMLAGRIRVVVRVETPIPVRMVSEAGTPRRAGGAIVDRSRWELDDVWFMDVMMFQEGATLPTRVGFTDDFLFGTEVPLLPLRPLPEITRESFGTSLDYRARLEGTPVAIDVVPPTPTLAAYATAIDVSIAVGGEGSERSIAVEPDPNGAFHVRSGLTDELAAALSLEARASLAFRGGEEVGFRIVRALDERERTGLARGALELGGGGRGLVMRIVDEDGNGIAGATAELAGTPRVLRADRDGYALDGEASLEPGKRHALVVRRPGADPGEGLRIEFEAAEGVTDLGVVRPPRR